MVSEVTGVTAAGLVVTTKPTDDAGARTYDQFDWQAAMASVDGLRLYLDNLSENGVLAPRDCRILCEYHEDWAALDEEDAELVSAKHPGTSYGAYTTMNALVNEGGIGHLFERWKSMDGKPACRLVTTGGLAPGPAQGLLAAAEAMRAQRLAGSPLDTEDEHAEIVTSFAREVIKRQSKSKREGSPPAPEPNGEDREEAARFLSGLTLQCSQPARTYIAYAAPSMYVAPVLIRLGSDTPYPAFLMIDSPRLALNTAESLAAALYRRIVTQSDANQGKVQFIVADNELPDEYRRGFSEIVFDYDQPTVSTIHHPGRNAVEPLVKPAAE